MRAARDGRRRGGGSRGVDGREGLGGAAFAVDGGVVGRDGRIVDAGIDVHLQYYFIRGGVDRGGEKGRRGERDEG